MAMNNNKTGTRANKYKKFRAFIRGASISKWKIPATW